MELRSMKGSAKSKKGIFFTLIAVSLLGILLFTFSATYSYSLHEKASVVESRVEAMNSLIKEIDSDMKNAIYISGFRALIGLEDEIANTGTFVNDTKEAFQELFIYGTLGGQNVSVMANNTFPDWVMKINAQANQVGMNMTMNVTSVGIRQTGPWTIRIEVNSTVKVNDVKATANWTQSKSLYSDISIVGFEDPWYAVYTSNNVVKRINITIYENNFTTPPNNTINIRDHVAKTLYANYSGAPSFLQRFEGDFNASEYGIESFVQKSEISPYKSCPTETSSIDNMYWRCNSSVPVYKVANWSGFRIDNTTGMGNLTNITRVDRYMLEGFAI